MPVPSDPPVTAPTVPVEAAVNASRPLLSVRPPVKPGLELVNANCVVVAPVELTTTLPAPVSGTPRPNWPLPEPVRFRITPEPMVNPAKPLIVLVELPVTLMNGEFPAVLLTKVSVRLPVPLMVGAPEVALSVMPLSVKAEPAAPRSSLDV